MRRFRALCLCNIAFVVYGLMTPFGAVRANGGGGWTSAAPLAAARTGHSATLLPDGQLLVIGGTATAGSDAALPMVERYDPAADRWSPAAPLAVPLRTHTAAPLSDGRVLVVGTHVSPAFSVQLFALYNPRLGDWSGMQPLPMQFGTGSLVPLTDGTVLLVGCRAQRYDPRTGLWSLTGARPTGCGADEDATRLADGRVLVTGGAFRGGGYNDATLYDPATDRWTRAAPMHVGRAWHTTTLLQDGTVLAVGGNDLRGPHTETERYDPATDKWTLVAPLPAARYYQTATLFNDGSVLIVGGIGAGGDTAPATAALRYDPTTDTWVDAGTTYPARRGHTATLLGGESVLIAGGVGNTRGDAVADAARFVP